MADFCGFLAKIGVMGCFFACAKGVGGVENRKFVMWWAMVCGAGGRLAVVVRVVGDVRWKVLNGWYVGVAICGCVPGRIKIISDSVYGLKSPRNPQRNCCENRMGVKRRAKRPRGSDLQKAYNVYYV